jgi:hypothetical protein
MVVQLEIWDPIEVPPIACHKNEPVMQSRGGDEEIRVTDQEASSPEIATNAGKALYDRPC